MLETNEIQHHCQLLEQAIGQAAQACSAERAIPKELRDSVERLDRHADTARAVLQSKDDARIDRLLGEMALLAERAQRVCQNVAQLTAHTKSTVTHMHRQIQELKHAMQKR